MEKIDNSSFSIVQCKVFADGEKYFSLFDRYIPALDASKKCLVYAIDNVDCISRIVKKNPEASYVVYGDRFVNACIKSVFPSVETIDSNSENRKAYNIDMKFDCVIMNPPYEGNKNLYGKITLEAKKHATTVICLSPYINYLSISEKKDCHRVSNELKPFVKYVESVTSNSFDAAFDKKLAIIVLEDNISSPVPFDDLYFNEFKNGLMTKNIFDKIKRYCSNVDSCFKHLIDNKDFLNYKYRCSFVNIRGHVDSKTGNKAWDWTTIFDNKRKTNFSLTDGYCAFPFETEDECRNFINYCDTDILMFALFLVKKSFHNNKCNFKYLPYMKSFSKTWSEDEIAKELELSDDELAYIHDEMKNFGWKIQNCKHT